MKSYCWCVIVLVSGVASAGEGKLTPEQAKKLLPEAASIPYKEFANLLEGKKPPTTNQSPTYFVLAYSPPAQPPEGIEKDFNVAGLSADKLTKAMAVSKNRGFASIIQEEYITDCVIESDDRQAKGRVAFNSDAYTGSIHFQAAKVKGDWVIGSFEWPHLKVRFVRGENGNWTQEKLKTQPKE